MVQNQLSKWLTLKNLISSQWCHSRKLVNGATKDENKVWWEGVILTVNIPHFSPEDCEFESSRE